MRGDAPAVESAHDGGAASKESQKGVRREEDVGIDEEEVREAGGMPEKPFHELISSSVEEGPLKDHEVRLAGPLQLEEGRDRLPVDPGRGEGDCDGDAGLLVEGPGHGGVS